MNRAATLLNATLVWDNHTCLPLRPDDLQFLPMLKRHRQMGVNVVSVNVGFGSDSIEQHIRMLAHYRQWIRDHPEDYLLVQTTTDVQRAKSEGKLGVTFDIEGAGAVSNQASLVGLYYDLGVRWMLIAYNKNNLVGGGCHDDDTGLTPYGGTVLDEMHRVGMVVCCSHTGPRTVAEVIDHVDGPVIFSHSNARALKEHPRNITNAMMQACAAKGGVIGINGIGIFLGDNDNSTATFLRHVDHAVQLIGPAHVGIGLDYVYDAQDLADFLKSNASIFPPNSGYDTTVNMVSPEQFPEIVEGMIRLGYDDAAISGILGGNFYRVAEAVWK